jgi:hypothetical protein
MITPQRMSKDELNNLKYTLHEEQKLNYSLIENIKRLRQENEQLKMINKEYERLNKEKHRGFKIINVQEYNIDELLSYKKYKDNWNKLKEYIQKDYDLFSELIDPKYGCATGALSRVKDKMQELERNNSNSC